MKDIGLNLSQFLFFIFNRSPVNVCGLYCLALCYIDIESSLLRNLKGSCIWTRIMCPLKIRREEKLLLYNLLWFVDLKLGYLCKKLLWHASDLLTEG